MGSSWSTMRGTGGSAAAAQHAADRERTMLRSLNGIVSEHHPGLATCSKWATRFASATNAIERRPSDNTASR
jgi:hypothetical protein